MATVEERIKKKTGRIKSTGKKVTCTTITKRT